MKKEHSLFASVRTFSRKICHSVGQIYSPLTAKFKGPQRKIKAVATAGVLGLAAAVTSLSVMGCPGPHDSTKEQQSPKLYPNPITGTSIQVWQEVGVTDLQMDTAFQNLVDGYDYLIWNPALQAKIKDNVKEIHIMPTNVGVDYTIDGLGKYSINLYYAADMDDALEYYASSVIAHIQQKNIIRLAKELDNSKETVRLSMGKSKLEKMI